jgi:hypothetical protein
MLVSYWNDQNINELEFEFEKFAVALIRTGFPGKIECGLELM